MGKAILSIILIATIAASSISLFLPRMHSIERMLADDVRGMKIPKSGHFIAEEQPEQFAS